MKQMYTGSPDCSDGRRAMDGRFSSHRTVQRRASGLGLARVGPDLLFRVLESRFDFDPQPHWSRDRSAQFHLM